MLDLNAIKTSLEIKLAELQTRATELDGAIRTPGSSDSEERAVELEINETLTAVSDVTNGEIHEIQHALRRIETGKYEVCDLCGKHITQARLQALPWTSKCVHCA